MKTINITDYQMITSALAKVVISTTGDVDSKFMRAELIRKLEGSAIPVAGSFKRLTDTTAVGFIRANTAVRNVTEKDMGSYRKMTANVLMDKADNSLWEVKEGATGRYLSRQDQEDLTALMASATQRRMDAPRVAEIVIAKAAAQEFVAFVDKDGDMDYGMATATNSEKVRVVSFKRRAPVEVTYANVVSISQVPVPKEIHKQVVAALTPAQKQDANAYWQQLYYFAPDYLRQIQEDVNAGTVL